MKIIFLAFVLALTKVLSKWAAPIEVTSFVDPTRINPAMFTDSSSGITYVAYCNSTSGFAYFAYLDNSGLFLTGPEILNDKLRCYRLDISGPHDGQHVFITMEARRSLSLDDCTKENNYETCDDIFVFESEDAGQSWLPPRNIGGVPGDQHIRRSFTVLTNWNTHYFWIIYNRYENGASNIATSRYDTKNRVFNEEKILVEKYGEMNYYPLITIDESGKTKLVVFYTTPYSLSLQTIVSLDDGVTWNKGAKVNKPSQDEKMVYKAIKSKGKYIMAGLGKGSVINFAFSEDLGKTWSELKRAPGNDLEEVQFCSTENPNGPDAGLVVLHSVEKKFKMSYSPIPLEEYKNAYVPDMLYYVGVRLFMNCYYVGKELKMRFMYQIRSPHQGASMYRLYIIDNDDLVTTPADEVKEVAGHKEDL